MGCRSGLDWLEGIALPELVEVVLGFVAFLQIEVVVREEMVVVLRTHHFSLQALLHILVGVVVAGLVLLQIVVVVLIVEVFGTHMGPLRGRISEVLHHPLETSASLVLVGLSSAHLDIESPHLLSDVVHRSLQIALPTVGREVQRLKRRERPHDLLIGEYPHIPRLELPSHSLELLSGKLNPMLLDKAHEGCGTDDAPLLLVDESSDSCELEAEGLHELLPELLDGTVVLEFLLKEVGQFTLAVVAQQLVGGLQTDPRVAHQVVGVLWVAVGQVVQVLRVGQVRLRAARQPDQVLAFAFVGSDAVHPQEVYQVLRLHLIIGFAVQLLEDLVFVEVAGLHEAHTFVLEFELGVGQSLEDVDSLKTDGRFLLHLNRITANQPRICTVLNTMNSKTWENCGKYGISLYI